MFQSIKTAFLFAIHTVALETCLQFLYGFSSLGPISQSIKPFDSNSINFVIFASFNFAVFLLVTAFAAVVARYHLRKDLSFIKNVNELVVSGVIFYVVISLLLNFIISFIFPTEFRNDLLSQLFEMLNHPVLVVMGYASAAIIFYFSGFRLVNKGGVDITDGYSEITKTKKDVNPIKLGFFHAGLIAIIGIVISVIWGFISGMILNLFWADKYLLSFFLSIAGGIFYIIISTCPVYLSALILRKKFKIRSIYKVVLSSLAFYLIVICFNAYWLGQSGPNLDYKNFITTLVVNVYLFYLISFEMFRED